MTFSRLLIICVAIWLVLRLLRRLSDGGRHITPAQPEHYEPMARCEKCGVYLPASALSRSNLCGKCAGA